MGQSTLARTAFDAVQRAIPGAEFAQWEGWRWIAGFGDTTHEHQAVRTACGVWDQSPRQKWDIQGPEADLAVDRFFTNDMRSLQIGQLRYGAFCDDDGSMLGDGTAFRFGRDRFRVVTALLADGEAIEHAAGDAEYELSRVTDRAPHLQLQGPASRQVLASLTAADISGLGYYRFLPEAVMVGGAPAWVARCGYSGELGYELYCDARHAETLWNAIAATGRVAPYGLNAVELLRQEAGLIAIGSDYFPGRTDPYEMNLDRVVKLDKPAFRGRDALRRIAAAPPRRMTTLGIEGDEVPVRGATVRRDGRPVGEVRSACASPTLAGVIAIAVLETPLIEPGRRFEVELGTGTTAGTVAGYPAYDPRKLRPRA
ncbi:MAG: aminomethyltransferase family protein [Gaiellales bacterium]